ncbi:hypothetical protein GJ744_008531 [Endocarpon pusillum]|uniref:Uncharacterized protein n=1 Tax=Endocarpon pusillum TaxID=364733 RepID=A0A8H7E572_9EURO|nr:hypothetical protein GJ744_008531 [Endocarpon pusillum]
MANGSQGSGGPSLAASGQGNRHTRQKTSPSQQASRQARQASQQARQQDLPRNPPQAPQETFQQTHQQPNRRTDGVSNGNSVPEGTTSSREASGKVTSNINPASSSSTPPRRPLIRPSTTPSAGSGLQDIAPPNRHPPNAGGAIGASILPYPGSKLYERLTRPLLGPASATASPLKPSLGSSPSPGSDPSPGSSPSPGPSPHDRLSGAPSGSDARTEPRIRLSCAPETIAGHHIRLQLKTEFCIATRNNQEHITNWLELARILMDGYNEQIGTGDPRIEVLDLSLLATNSHSWIIASNSPYEGYVMRENNYIWWQLKMKSPIFNVVPHSPWKHHVKAFWKFLSDNYRIITLDQQYTQICVSLDPGYTLTELKQIASSIIHFETAIEPLQPEKPDKADKARSIWLHSRPFAPSRRGRSASVSYIDQCSTWTELLNAINDGLTSNYAWDFWVVRHSGFLIFRKPSPCLGPPEIFSWAELTMAFILAAMRHGSPEYLRRCSHDVGALKDFVGRVDIPGNGPHHLDRLWEGISPSAAREPMMDTRAVLSMDEGLAQLGLVEPWRYWVRIKEMVALDAEQCAASVPQALQRHLNRFETSA